MENKKELQQCHRRWAFTLQLDDDGTPKTSLIPGLRDAFDTTIRTTKKEITFILLQVERAPTTGQLHAQGAVALSGATRLANMKKWLPRAHWEPAKQWDKLLIYCRKAESRVHPPEEWGTETTQGQRSDLSRAIQMIQSGSTMREIARESPLETVKFYKGLQYLQSQLQEPENREKKVGLFWGQTGTGKTRMAFDCLGADLYTVFDAKAPWFDGYIGQEQVLIDECGTNLMHFNMLKRVLDRYPMQVPVKGGSVWWKPRTIVLTSNIPVEDWYPGIQSEDLAAIKRRMRIFEFPKDAQLAKAWLNNELIEPTPKRMPAYEPEPPSGSQISEGCDLIRDLERQDAFCDLYGY